MNEATQTVDGGAQDVLDHAGGGAPIVADPDPNAQRLATVDPLPDPAEKNGQLFTEIDLSHETNSHGQLYAGFDPSIHAQNEDGTPKVKKDGTYALKRGRKSGAVLVSAAQSPEELPNPSISVPSNEPPKKVNYKVLGQVYAGIFFSGTSSIIGPEWLPQNNDEKKNVENAFSAYAESTGANDLPPGIALVLTIGAYSAARLQHENTRSKFGKVKDKIFNFFYWAKGRFVK